MNRPAGPSTVEPDPRPATALEHVTVPPPKNVPDQSRPARRRWIWVVLLILLAAALYFFWPKNKGAKSDAGLPAGAKTKGGKGPQSTPVVAARARKGDIGVYVTGLGSVTPIYTVTVKSRVDGELMYVRYKEGDIVHQGDILVEIDPRPYEVQLEQAEGQLAKDEATLANARIDLARYETLLKQNAIPEQQVATQRAAVAQDEGTIKSDQGLIHSAKLNLTYSRIIAPIAGRVGLRLVDPGNIVHASDPNGLLVITQIQPISAIFTITQSQLPAVLQKKRAGQNLSVDAYDEEMKVRIAQGTLTTIDNQIDPSTSTVKLRATFANKNSELFPNQFVNARLLVEMKHGVTLIPSAALQRNSQMNYVYLVKPDSTVTVRQVTVGVTEGEDIEITSSVQPGDVVVMTGVDKLQEGSKVSVQVAGENTRGAGKGPAGSAAAGGAAAKRPSKPPK
jgi:multidrug efflux system membrane fusion protein